MRALYSLSENDEEGKKVGSTIKGKYDSDGELSGHRNGMSREKGVEYVVYFPNTSVLFPRLISDVSAENEMSNSSTHLCHPLCFHFSPPFLLIHAFVPLQMCQASCSLSPKVR